MRRRHGALRLSEQEGNFLQALSLLCHQYEQEGVEPTRLQVLMCATAFTHSDLIGSDVEDIVDAAMAIAECTNDPT